MGRDHNAAIEAAANVGHANFGHFWTFLDHFGQLQVISDRDRVSRGFFLEKFLPEAQQPQSRPNLPRSIWPPRLPNSSRRPRFRERGFAALASVEERTAAHVVCFQPTIRKCAACVL
jgi:hypothetical protein